MAKKSKKIEVDGQGFGGSMADLLKAQGFATPSPSDAEEQSAATEVKSASAPDSRLWRAQVERKGRKGKTVTRLYGVTLDKEQAKVLCSAIGKAMGARAFIEDDEILLQGKHAERVLKWLRTYQG